MSDSRKSTLTEVGLATAIYTLFPAVGAGVSAGLRGRSVKESAAIVGLGTGLFVGGAALFCEKKSEKNSETNPTFLKITAANAVFEIIGTTLGYASTKLFINTAASKSVFVDAGLGFPITIGMVFCTQILVDYYSQKQNAVNMRLLK